MSCGGARWFTGKRELKRPLELKEGVTVEFADHCVDYARGSAAWFARLMIVAPSHS
jgi:hypothetical protein